jgi:hypothetical protein
MLLTKQGWSRYVSQADGHDVDRLKFTLLLKLLLCAA